MTEDKGIDYQIEPENAKDLMGVVQFPHDLRLEVLQAMERRIGSEGMRAIFSQFIGLANSVIANNREMIELYLITEVDYHPHTAEKINLPTLFGALNGVALALGVDQAKTCGGCAFRLGTCANQSPCTTVDADWCSNPGEPDFMCHEDMDEKGNPKRKCTGYTQFRKQRRAA